MSSTMLQLVQQATNELGVPTPTYVAGNTNQDVTQILALMNACGYELLSIADWQELTIPYLFYTQSTSTTGDLSTSALTITGIPSTAGLDSTYQVTGTGLENVTMVVSVDSGTQVTLDQYPTVAGTAVDLQFQKIKYSLPSDYSSIVPRTQWSKSQHWEMLGPESPQQWEWLLSGYISTGPRIRWRLLGNYFQIWPGTSDALSLGFEYRSAAWAATAAGVAKNSFTVDTDTCIYPDRLMVLFTKLKYFEGKGFDTTAMYRNYMRELETAIGQNTSAANLSFAPQPSSVLIGYENIPDSGYGG